MIHIYIYNMNRHVQERYREGQRGWQRRSKTQNRESEIEVAKAAGTCNSNVFLEGIVTHKWL